MAWLAELAFFTFYFIAWLVGQIPHTTWLSITAIAAAVLAVLLLIDNRNHFAHRQA